MKKLVFLMLFLFSLTCVGCGKSKIPPPLAYLPGITPSSVTDNFRAMGFKSPYDSDPLYGIRYSPTDATGYFIYPCEDDTTKVDHVFLSFHFYEHLYPGNETLKKTASTTLFSDAIVACMPPDLTTADIDIVKTSIERALEQVLSAEAVSAEDMDEILSSELTDEPKAVIQTTILDIPMVIGYILEPEDSPLKEDHSTSIVLSINY